MYSFVCSKVSCFFCFVLRIKAIESICRMLALDLERLSRDVKGFIVEY